jgi:hypothetical protein
VTTQTSAKLKDAPEPHRIDDETGAEAWRQAKHPRNGVESFAKGLSSNQLASDWGIPVVNLASRQADYLTHQQAPAQPRRTSTPKLWAYVINSKTLLYASAGASTINTQAAH